MQARLGMNLSTYGKLLGSWYVHLVSTLKHHFVIYSVSLQLAIFIFIVVIFNNWYISVIDNYHSDMPFISEFSYFPTHCPLIISEYNFFLPENPTIILFSFFFFPSLCWDESGEHPIILNVSTFLNQAYYLHYLFIFMLLLTYRLYIRSTEFPMMKLPMIYAP